MDDAFLAALRTAVARAHPVLTRLDQASGDGDFGDNLAGGVRAALGAAVPADVLADVPADVPAAAAVRGLRAAEHAFLDEVGGSSGPLYGLLLQQLRAALEQAPRADADAVRAGLAGAVAAVQRVGGARPGERTMLDPMAAAAASTGGLADLVRAAVDGAAATAGMLPRRGRASYVGERALGLPDPGAVGVALVLGALADALEPAAGAGGLATALVEGLGAQAG
ncbi:DAK2 domain-containing protein [Kineococcus sp. T13]|nr:DAK2 domain-containing protein [Kineococcus vitellinus]